MKNRKNFELKRTKKSFFFYVSLGIGNRIAVKLENNKDLKKNKNEVFSGPLFILRDYQINN